MFHFVHLTQGITGYKNSYLKNFQVFVDILYTQWKKTVCPIIEWKLSFVNNDHWLYWMLVCFFQSGKGAIIKRLLCSHRPNFFNTPWFSLYFPICFSHFLGPKSTSAPTGCRTGESTSLLVPGDVGPDLTRVPCPSKHIGTYGNIWNLYRPYIWSGGNKHMISR
jgi:hypothetical protein